MFDHTLAIVDIETTGMSAFNNRIIEIAIIRIEKNKIVDEFTTLVNPQTHVSPFIQDFTGITVEDLKTAPLFEDVKERVIELLDSAVFVAHNVRFDYSFVKSELRRLGIPYKAKTFCTVRLSRRLYPEHRSHSLESIIARHNFSFAHRHRAYDDALVLWQFLKKIKKTFPKKKVLSAWDALTKSLYSADPGIKTQIDTLPETPGVYLFYDAEGRLLYVGKSNNISDRVIAHFSEDTLSSKHLIMMKEIKNIDHLQTAGELGALLLESRLIKKLKPVYNRRLREKKTVYILGKGTDKKGYPTLIQDSCDVHEVDMKTTFRIFNSKTSMKEFLEEFVKKYHLCPKLLGLEKGKGSCFAYKLGQCKGACIGKENKTLYNGRFLIATLENQQFRAWPFRGPVEVVEKNDEEEMWEKFTFDDWMLLKHENNRGEVEEFEPEFEIDTYSILNRYIKNGKQNKIRNL